MNVRSRRRIEAVPHELEDALRSARLWGAYETLPPSHRREHAMYVAEAKTGEARARRAERCVGMVEGALTQPSSKPIVVRID